MTLVSVMVVAVAVVMVVASSSCCTCASNYQTLRKSTRHLVPPVPPSPLLVGCWSISNRPVSPQPPQALPWLMVPDLHASLARALLEHTAGRLPIPRLRDRAAAACRGS